MGYCLPEVWYPGVNGCNSINGSFSDLLFPRVLFFSFMCVRMCVCASAGTLEARKGHQTPSGAIDSCEPLDLGPTDQTWVLCKCKKHT